MSVQKLKLQMVGGKLQRLSVQALKLLRFGLINVLLPISVILILYQQGPEPFSLVAAADHLEKLADGTLGVGEPLRVDRQGTMMVID